MDIRKYEFIDALRGYAILLVVLVHSSQVVQASHPILQLIMFNGARGVQLFFIASALTLCLSWESRSSGEEHPIRNFFIRRFFRIAPMFYVAIAFYSFLYGFSPRYYAPNGTSWWFVPLTALFLNGFHPATINSVVPGGWSIAVEMTFYFIIPFLLPRITTIRWSVYFVVFTICVYVIYKLVLITSFGGGYPYDQKYLLTDFISMSFFGQLPVFAMGILAYFIFKNRNLLKGFLILNYSFLLLLLLILPTVSILRLFLNHIFIGFIFSLFALNLSIFPVTIFVNRVITQLGKISFSMYLTHFAVLHYFSKWGVNSAFKTNNTSSILYYLCVVAVSAPLSYLFYITVERQGVLFGKYIINRLENTDQFVSPCFHR